jgi:hypothetical protein
LDIYDDYTYIRFMEKEKRNGRTYKIADSNYKKALMRGIHEKPLATLLEEVATHYGNGYGITYVTPAGARGTIVSRLKSGKK